LLISKAYRELNKQLHADRDDYGRASRNWVAMVDHVVKTEGHASVLDYGCGKGELKLCLPDLPIAEYDPAIEGKDSPPEPADLVMCTDVLEHIEPVHINAVIRDLRRLTKRKAIFVISNKESSKTLADGRNAHLIIESVDWWRQKLASEFRIAFVESKGHECYIEAFPRLVTKPKHAPAPITRRPMTREWLDKFDEIRRVSVESGDLFSRIETIRMFESVDDEMADMQVICNMLETVDDIDMAIRRAIRLSRKAILITVAIKESDAPMWKPIFERHLTISDWHVEPVGVCCIGSPSIRVGGLKPIGAVESEERFEQIKAAVARVSKRIEVAPAHGKRAILACYGPSLKKNIKILKQEAAEIDSTIISVSGAHDYLLENGIAPHMHIECDPRAHKVENLGNPQQGTIYYIASVCHENMITKLENFDLRLWHVYDASHIDRLLAMGEHPTTCITGGGSVGLRAIPALYALGYRDFSIYGMDCSFEINEDGESVTQWAGKHAGKRQDVVPCDCAGRVFATAPILMTYATQFLEIVQKSGPDIKYRLYGDGLLQNMARLYSRLPQAA
jgi:uncharacterized Rossmann fold enzyme